MKKIYILLEFLNNNNIKFKLKVLDDEHNLLITTNKFVFETFNYEHEVIILNNNSSNTDFNIDELKEMYE